jgi:GTP-binding protein
MVMQAPTFDASEIEAARVLFAGPIAFIMGAASVEGLPPADLPEVAFAGRSNVGKSSLLNALTGRKSLARASADPGRTRQVNLFALGQSARLVDLPGYGFAKAPRREARRFQGLARAYIAGRPTLKRVYLLVDARHGLKSTDAEALSWLDVAAVSYQVVLTKADKLSPAALAATAAATAAAVARRPAAFPRLAVTSATTGEGIAQLRAEIALALAP